MNPGIIYFGSKIGEGATASQSRTIIFVAILSSGFGMGAMYMLGRYIFRDTSLMFPILGATAGFVVGFGVGIMIAMVAGE